MFNCFGFFGSSVKILLVPPGQLSVIRNGKRDFDILPLERWVKHETWESYKLFAVSKTCPMAWRPNHLQSEPLWYFLCQNWNKIQVAIFCVETEIRPKNAMFCVKTETISKIVMFWFGLTVDGCIHLLGRQIGKRVIFSPPCYHVYIWWSTFSAFVYIWWSIA